MTRNCAIIVQTNLSGGADVPEILRPRRNDDATSILRACAELGIEGVPAPATGFDGDVPAALRGLGDRPTTVYGATGFVDAVDRSGLFRPGSFLDRDAMRYSSYLARYGRAMLNWDAEVTTLGDLSARGLPADRLLFLRPETDGKAFPGDVVAFGELPEWTARLSAGGFSFGPELRVVVAEPCGIDREWRVFMRGAEAREATRYRLRGRLAPERGAPAEVLAFAEEQARRFAPGPAFAVDVAESGGRLWIVELTGINSAGLYAADPRVFTEILAEACLEAAPAAAPPVPR